MQATLKGGGTVEFDAEPMSMGAEGEIFKATDGHRLVKLYTKTSLDRQRQLELIINSYNAVEDSQFWSKYFCWPTEVVTSPRLGLVMPKAPDEYRSLTWFLNPKTRQKVDANLRGNWQTHLGIAIKLSRAIRRLHQKGLCHADLSSNNCLVHMPTASLMIIDLDGLVVPNFMPPQVFGTPDFMAPEIVAREAKPSTFTDLHALAVLLYRILLFHHPLRGPKLHAASSEQDNHLAMGKNALFIEHPTDRSNRPRSLNLTTEILGEQLKSLFMAAFVDGLHNRAKRPPASRWEEALIRLSDRLVACENLLCEGKYYPFLEGRTTKCPFCKAGGPSTPLVFLDSYRPIAGKPNQFRDDNWTIISDPMRSLFEWHVYADRSPGPDSDLTPYATFVFDKRMQVWLLQNRIESALYVCDQHHNWHAVPKNQAVVLEHGLRIRFDRTDTSRVFEVRLSHTGV